LAPESPWAPIKGVLKLKTELALPAGEAAPCKFRLRLTELAPRYARDHVASLLVTLRPTDGGGPLDADLPVTANDDAPRTASPAGPPRQGDARRFRADGCRLQADLNRVSLQVKNRTATARRAFVEVEWAPEIALYLLSVGIANYEKGRLPRLSLAVKDAEAVTELFKGQEGKLFARVYARTLTDAQATKANIMTGLDWLRDKATVF